MLWFSSHSSSDKVDIVIKKIRLEDVTDRRVLYKRYEVNAMKHW